MHSMRRSRRSNASADGDARRATTPWRRPTATTIGSATSRRRRRRANRRARATRATDGTTDGTTGDDDAGRDATRGTTRATTTRGPFGDATPNDGTTRATTPTRREEAAFATTPTTPRAVDDEATAFVEAASGDLGALFGASEGDDDWLTPRGGGGGGAGAASTAVERASASASAGRAEAAATTTTYATRAPFASPAASRDDGMDFFDDLDAAEETASAPAAIPFEAPGERRRRRRRRAKRTRRARAWWRRTRSRASRTRRARQLSSR